MGAGPDNAHVAAEHIPKLRHLVDAELAKPFSERINPLVVCACLAGNLMIVRVHGAELQNREAAVLHARACLHMKQRTG